MVATVAGRIIEAGNKITAYLLEDEYGNRVEMETEFVKERLESGEIICPELRLTSNYKLRWVKKKK